MIVVDVNILLYAYDSLSPHHVKARAWLEAAFEGPELIGIPWQTVSAFLRISTNPTAYQRRIPMEQLLPIVEQWMDRPNVRFLAPEEDHWPVFRRMILEGQASGQLIPDAELAALAVGRGGQLCTNDRDFNRFPGLRVIYPLG